MKSDEKRDTAAPDPVRTALIGDADIALLKQIADQFGGSAAEVMKRVISIVKEFRAPHSSAAPLGIGRRQAEAHASALRRQAEFMDDPEVLLYAAHFLDALALPATGGGEADPAAQFVMWAMMEGSWQGCDIDGGAAQDKALALGLIEETKYDPSTHAHNESCEPGDRWFVPSAKLLSALTRPEHSTQETKR